MLPRMDSLRKQCITDLAQFSQEFQVQNSFMKRPIFILLNLLLTGACPLYYIVIFSIRCCNYSCHLHSLWECNISIATLHTCNHILVAITIIFLSVLLLVAIIVRNLNFEGIMCLFVLHSIHDFKPMIRGSKC